MSPTTRIARERTGGAAPSRGAASSAAKNTKGGRGGAGELTLLGAGRATRYPSRYAPQLLERFPNRHPDANEMVLLDCPEFTSLCPVTRQPDFGRLVIRYIPGDWIVESKSLKLYLFSFRNHGAFHEDVCNVILDDLRSLLQPRYIEVRGLFRARGGIAIHPFAVWAPPGSTFEADARARLFADE